MATGNIKISDLTWLKSDNGKQVTGEEVFPISYYDSQTSSYSSYKVKINDVKSYVDSALGVSKTNEDVSHLKRDLGQCTSYIYNGANVGSNQYENGYIFERDIVVENGNHDKALVYKNAKADNIDAISTVTTQSMSGFSMSNPIIIPKGYICLFEFPKDIYINYVDGQLTDVSIFTKYTTGTYHTSYTQSRQNVTYADHTITIDTITADTDAGTKNTGTLEALPHNYRNIDFPGGDHYLSQLPSSDMMTFFATEDCNIIISAPTELLENKKVYMVNYSVFSDMSNKFIGKQSSASITIAEAIASLEARIASLEVNTGTIGKTVAEEIDNINMPKYRGGEMVKIMSRDPNSLNGSVDIPSYPGQFWVNTETKTIMVSVASNSVDDWIVFTK